jgi:hypothetical protein
MWKPLLAVMVSCALSTPTYAQSMLPAISSVETEQQNTEVERVVAPDGRTIYYIVSLPGNDFLGNPNRQIEMGMNGDTSLRVLLRPRPSRDPEQNLNGFSHLILSPDGRSLYFQAPAWTTSDAIHSLDIATKRSAYVTAGGIACIARQGEYQGDLVVEQHRYFVQGGSHDDLYLYEPSGKEIGLVAQGTEASTACSALAAATVQPHAEPERRVLSAGADLMPPANTTAYERGRNDRIAWETWFNSLSGDYKAGAYYWSGQRSLPHPGPCASPKPDFTSGCLDAQARLAPSDARRKAEPDYRVGWNYLRGDAPSVAKPLVHTQQIGSDHTPDNIKLADEDPALSSDDPPWFLVSTTLAKCTPVSNIFPKAGSGDHYPSTPAGLIAGLSRPKGIDVGAYLASRPSYGPAGNLHPPGPLVALTDILGNLPTIGLVQGEQVCKDVLAVLLRAGTEGGAEQRWAAQNAATTAQWHVVYWAGAKTCTPLAEVVPYATTPEQALEIIRQSDTDAYMDNHPEEWERIIRTRGHNLRMVRAQMYCGIWNSIVHGP